nr:PPOX class F420-dependent oxidoreductase [Actinoplanes digitatis]
MATLEQLGSEKYVLLTTFRRDGRAVPTPSGWCPTGPGWRSGRRTALSKLKRIRNSGRVTVAACDMRGNATGEPIEARARIGDAADRRRVGEGLKRKYGMIARLTLLGSQLRRGIDGTVAVLVSAEPVT